MKWFVIKKISTTSAFIEQPSGSLCWTCGVAAEVWPLKDVKTIIHDYHHDEDFQVAFRGVRAGVDQAAVVSLKQMQVENVRAIGTKIYFRIAFIESSIFKIHFLEISGSK